MNDHNPYSPPWAAETFALHADPNSLIGVYRYKNFLIMHRDSKLPSRCVKSGVATDNDVDVRFSYHNPSLNLLIALGGPFGLFILFVVKAFVGQRITLTIPLSNQRQQNHTRSIQLAWVIGLTGGICIAWSSVWIAFSPAAGAEVLGLFVGLALIGTAVGVGEMKRKILQLTRATETHVWLHGVNRALLDDLPQFPIN